MAEITIIPAKNHADEIVRTAAYARVSSDSQDQLNSFAAQIRYYTELLKDSADAVFVDMYADEGTESGSQGCCFFQGLLCAVCGSHRYGAYALPHACL